MKFKKVTKDGHAVAGVIEALLMVALIATVISIIQLNYIPQVMEEREAEHMDEVSNQFSYLKAMIDVQSISESDVPIFSIITMGSRRLPYFITAKADGDLGVITSDDSSITIDYVDVSTLTSIKYKAYNSYFVDQTYILEGGGIIVDQPSGESVMRVNPSVSVVNETKVTISFDLPVFIDVPGKNYTYCNSENTTKCVIRTNYSGYNTQSFMTPVQSIRIYSDYLNAWNESLNNIVEGAVDVSQGSNYVEIKPNDPPNDLEINVVIKEIYIHAQIGPGWII